MSNHLDGKPCWDKASGRYIGEVIMTGHGQFGFRCLVAIDEAGAVEDWPSNALVFKEPPRASAMPAGMDMETITRALAAAGLAVVPASSPAARTPAANGDSPPAQPPRLG